MKSKCKDVKITQELIESCIHKCLKPTFKRKKNGCVRLFARVYGIEPKYMLPHMIARDNMYEVAVKFIAEGMMQQYLDRDLQVPPPYVRKQMRDHSSGKLRDIATLSILHQFWDYVAVELLDEMMSILGTYQCASLKGRGQKYGYDAIKRWMQGYAGRKFYAVKLDVRKCYDSIKKNNLIAFFFKRTKNKDLRWLLESIINLSPSPGLLIGSYFAQYACNLYLSQLYHFASERIAYRGSNPVDHVLGYMDDLLMLGKNRKALRAAAHKVVEYAATLGLSVKPCWEVYTVTTNHPADMLGFKFYTDRIRIRSRIYLRIQRLTRKLYKSGVMTLRQALRLVSYKGYMLLSNKLRSRKRYSTSVFSIAQYAVSCCA